MCNIYNLLRYFWKFFSGQCVLFTTHYGSCGNFSQIQFFYLSLQIRSKAKPMCVDSSVDSHNMHKPVNMWPCHNQGGNQVSSSSGG